MITSDLKDVVSFFDRPFLCRGVEFCSLTRSFSPPIKRTTIKTIGIVLFILRVFFLSYNPVKIFFFLWVNRWKSTKKFIDAKFSKLAFFRESINNWAIQIGCFITNSKSDLRLVQSSFSRFDHIHVMVSLFAGSEFNVLQNVISFGTQNLCKALQRLIIFKAIVTLCAGLNLSWWPSARGLKFLVARWLPGFKKTSPYVFFGVF